MYTSHPLIYPPTHPPTHPHTHTHMHTYTHVNTVHASMYMQAPTVITSAVHVSWGYAHVHVNRRNCLNGGASPGMGTPQLHVNCSHYGLPT